MTAIIHGLVSGLIWSVILGSCLIAIAAVITAMGTANERVRSEAAGTTRSFKNSPIGCDRDSGRPPAGGAECLVRRLKNYSRDGSSGCGDSIKVAQVGEAA
jgi:hypothetical protein